jgi:hypothetical protein
MLGFVNQERINKFKIWKWQVIACWEVSIELSRCFNRTVEKSQFNCRGVSIELSRSLNWAVETQPICETFWEYQHFDRYFLTGLYQQTRKNEHFIFKNTFVSYQSRSWPRSWSWMVFTFANVETFKPTENTFAPLRIQ